MVKINFIQADSFSFTKLTYNELLVFIRPLGYSVVTANTGLHRVPYVPLNYSVICDDELIRFVQYPAKE